MGVVPLVLLQIGDAVGVMALGDARPADTGGSCSVSQGHCRTYPGLRWISLISSVDFIMYRIYTQTHMRTYRYIWQGTAVADRTLSKMNSEDMWGNTSVTCRRNEKVRQAIRIFLNEWSVTSEGPLWWWTQLKRKSFAPSPTEEEENGLSWWLARGSPLCSSLPVRGEGATAQPLGASHRRVAPLNSNSRALTF